jgi:hypothetical protein
MEPPVNYPKRDLSLTEAKTMTLADVEVRIFKREDKGYRVEIAVTGEGEPEPGYLDPAKQPPNPTDNHYADPAYGQALYNWFFADDTLKKIWARVRGTHNSRRIRLRIDPDAEALHVIPWEALCEPQAGKRPALHLAASSATPFSRYLAVDVPIGTLISRRPIRILVVAPRQVDFEEKYLVKFPGMATINPQAEFRSLEQALQVSIGLGRVELVPLNPPCSLARIGQELRRGGYHGLHLVCHGLYDRQSDRAALLLADADDRVVRVTDETIATMLGQQLIDAGNTGGTQLRLVFLASCQSATRSSADAFRGLAPSLVKAGVPAVVAMQAQVGDETACQFATTFYEAVLDHGQVDLAANEARQDLMAQLLPGPVIPVLFLRMRNGRLFDDGKASLKDVETYLDMAIPQFELRQKELMWQDSIPKEPYKSLYSFEIKDSPIFFGRQEATDRLHDTLLKDRLTVLHARSGSGKTSLLNAGLSPRLIREGRLPAYVRGQDDPTAAIKREIAPTSLGPWPVGLDALPLQEFLGLACRRLSRQTKELVIILDQFEEFFIFCTDQEKRQAFFYSLGQCYRDQELRVRFILSIRKDYFSDLAELTKAIPTVFYNQYLLGPMTRAEATDAITGPTRLLPRRVTYEPVLLDRLLDDLASGEIELPHLQIVCTELYSSLPVEASAITLNKYQALSGAAGILGNYVNTVLDRLPHAQSVLAREVLKALVSPQSTSRMLPESALAELVRADREQIDDALAALVRDRLLHREDVEGEVRYELAHDILAAHISEWITVQEAQLIEIRDMLRVAVGQNKDHGYYLSQEQLDLVERYRDDLRLKRDEFRLALLSTIAVDGSADYWLDRVVDAGMMDVELIRLLQHTLWSRYQDLSQTISTVRSEMALDSSTSSRRRLEAQLQDVSEKRSRHQRHLERLSAHQGQALSPLIFAKDLFSELMSHYNLLTEVIGQLDTEILRQINFSGRMRLDLIRKEAANERDRIFSEVVAIESQFGDMLAILDQAPLRGLLIAKQELESRDSNALDGGGYTNLTLEELKGAHENITGPADRPFHCFRARSKAAHRR